MTKQEQEQLVEFNRELLAALRALFEMPEYDGTAETSQKRLRAKSKAKRLIAKGGKQ